MEILILLSSFRSTRALCRFCIAGRSCDFRPSSPYKSTSLPTEMVEILEDGTNGTTFVETQSAAAEGFMASLEMSALDVPMTIEIPVCARDFNIPGLTP